MADLTVDELLELRDNYLVDRVDEVAVPKVYLSHYNAANRKVFASDTVLQRFNEAVETDQAEELERVHETKRVERIEAGDDAAAALEAADAVRKEAKFRLIRARVRKLMLRDPGFVGSIADAKARALMVDEWRAEISEDEKFSRARQGAFSSVPVFRR